MLISARRLLRFQDWFQDGYTEVIRLHFNIIIMYFMYYQAIVHEQLMNTCDLHEKTFTSITVAGGTSSNQVLEKDLIASVSHFRNCIMAGLVDTEV